MGLPESNEIGHVPGHVELGGIRCSTHTIDQFVEEVEYLLENRTAQPRMLLCVNAHIYNLAYEDRSLRETINRSRIVTADGMSMVWMARFRGVRVTERCNMTEAFRAFFTKPTVRPSRGILVGVTPEVASAAAKEIEAASSHCRIVNTYSGFLREDEYDEIFRTMDPVDFIFVGMGTPRTERICEIAAARQPNAIVWGIGAGTICILGGAMKEAPAFMRRSGLQWLYRLGHEPLRLWRRYVFGNPMFVYRMLRSGYLSRREFAKHSTVPRG
ncbi:MAG: beta-1,4-N-acetyl- mannosaminyltransferase [Candidatus Hydrogenedentota bacterium]